jgi:predicted O-linked N-acetylglucosamine transferase (SPINDLY family)
LYRALLAEQPTHAETLYLLGSLLAQRGDCAAGAVLLRQALKALPHHAQAHNNLGIACHRLGDLSEAIVHFRQAIALEPAFAAAHNNLGDALRERGELDAAIAQLRQAIRLKPDYAEALNNLGLALIEQDPAEARAALQRAVEWQPNYLRAWRNLGHLHQIQLDLARAVECYEHALALDPGDARLHAELGGLWQQLGDLPRAIARYREALARDPQVAATHNNLASALQETGALSPAVDAYLDALRLQPDFPEAYNNLGNCLVLLGRPQEAEECYRQALTLRPDYHAAHSNYLLALNYLDLDPMAITQAHRAWGAQLAQPAPVASAQIRQTTARLRIGYVSPDFRTHSVAYFFLPLLRAHDHTRYEIYCYSDVKRPDVVTTECARLADHWRDMRGTSDDAMEAAVRADHIDILVDLAGHTEGNRLPLFARRVAPRQVSYLGYPNTTGLATMDYRITDARTDPAGCEPQYSERLLRLPHSFLCYAPPAHAPAVAVPPALSAGHITFGSFNNLAKISPGMVTLWSELLRGLPGTRLLLKNKSLRDPGVRARYTALFAAHGIAASRLQLVGWLPAGADHLALYHHVDVALDTHPYNGTTTTCEALWMGVPVVTLAGARHASRVGASLLQQVGLGELIAADAAGYVAVARRLAAAPQALAELRRTLRDRMQNSPLCRPDAFARDMENAYDIIWQAASG